MGRGETVDKSLQKINNHVPPVPRAPANKYWTVHRLALAMSGQGAVIYIFITLNSVFCHSLQLPVWITRVCACQVSFMHIVDEDYSLILTNI